MVVYQYKALEQHKFEIVGVLIAVLGIIFTVFFTVDTIRNQAAQTEIDSLAHAIERLDKRIDRIEARNWTIFGRINELLGYTETPHSEPLP